MKQTGITGWQLIWLLTTTEIISIISLRITPAIGIAKQDAWISMLMAGLISILLTILVAYLSLLHPEQTVVQFSQTLLGKWVGKWISLPYLMAWYVLPSILLRSFADFLQLMILDRTPLWVIMIMIMAVMTYLTYSAGITGISRFCEIVGNL